MAERSGRRPSSEVIRRRPDEIFRSQKQEIAGTQYVTTVNETRVRSLDEAREVVTIRSIEYRGLNSPDRPVAFIWNGGPGSASHFLHLALGPVGFRYDNQTPVTVAPIKLVSNPNTLLRNADLVLVDPPGTGFSDEPSQARSFYGNKEDAYAICQFIKQWYEKNPEKFNDPKFLIGQSYGATRIAEVLNMIPGGPFNPLGALSGISFNGAIFMGPSMGFSESGLRDVLTLPTVAMTAAYHGKTRENDFNTLATRLDGYIEALIEGYNSTNKNSTLPWAEWTSNLISGDERTQQLVRSNNVSSARDILNLILEGQQAGTYDTRMVLPKSPNPNVDPVTGDPAMGRYVDAYAMAFQAVMSRLGFYTEMKRRRIKVPPYKFIEWKKLNLVWNEHLPKNERPNLTGVNQAEKVAEYMRLHPETQVLFLMGAYDMATPFAETLFQIDQAQLPEDRTTVHLGPYGHLPTLNDANKASVQGMVRDFIVNAG